MKRLILTTTLLISFFVKSQNLVGVSRKNIEFIAKTEQWKTTSSTTKNGIPFIEVDDADSYKFYYFKNGICAVYLVFYNKIDSNEIKKVLDTTYHKQNNIWYTDNTVIDLAYDEILEGYFVKYKLIKQ
jgi:hypothetical protein